jgi:hypothetical protein
LTQSKAFLAHDAVAQALVRHAAFVGGFGGGSEPTFVNAAAVQAVGVGVVGMKLDAQTGLEKRAWHPVGRQAQQSAGARKFDRHFGGGVRLDDFELGDCVHVRQMS